MTGLLRSSGVPALGDHAAQAVGAVSLVLAVAMVAMAALLLRRLLLGSMRGAFECHVRTAGPAGTSRRGRWRAGVGRFEPARVVFYPALALSWWPRLVLVRDGLTVMDRRGLAEDGDPGPEDGVSTVVRVRAGERVVDLALDERAAGAFSVWVESGPPGRGVNVA